MEGQTDIGWNNHLDVELLFFLLFWKKLTEQRRIDELQRQREEVERQRREAEERKLEEERELCEEEEKRRENERKILEAKAGKTRLKGFSSRSQEDN